MPQAPSETGGRGRGVMPCPGPAVLGQMRAQVAKHHLPDIARCQTV